MEYRFREIETKWQQIWKEQGVYRVSTNSDKPKFYVLDMFPYPSGAGLHVGHPLGYIASDIFSRYKRLRGFNVLHPMGFDSFGLPAEQYALDTGQHPAVTTRMNIANFKSQLDHIGFCYDWEREVQTSDPRFYRWTQWIFLQLFHCFFNRETRRAELVADLVRIFEEEGNRNHPYPSPATAPTGEFSSAEWKDFDEKMQQDILMQYRLAYCGYGEVNWCEALGTVLANDEVINGVSERGGFPVVRKKLRQWYLRITEYADRLLEGLETVEFSEAMKEMQGNWIGRSVGAEIEFRLTPNPSPRGEGDNTQVSGKHFKTADRRLWKILKDHSRDNRKHPTIAESVLWERLRNNQLGFKVRRQHAIEGYIADFVFTERKLVIEVDGDYHLDIDQETYDQARSALLEEYGYSVIRFTNSEVENNLEDVIVVIKKALEKSENVRGEAPPLREERGTGGEATIRVFTTRPDTIFGVDFLVLAPEHELVEKISTPSQLPAVKQYLEYVASRSERERMAEKKISGVFTGAYATRPFDERPVPVWVSEYVLAGYGTGAIMAVPCGDERDHKFARHFDIPVTNIIGTAYDGENANPTRDAVLHNSGFLNGMVMHSAGDVVIQALEEQGLGKKKVNYKMRDAAFSRQRYWGEPFPIKWVNGIAYPLDDGQLPLELPHVDSYTPGPDGEGPLANIPEWTSAKLETNTMPGYAGSSWYFLRFMDPHNEREFCSRAAADYWNQVDLYIGGTEHAVGHLLYSRMWTKFLFDLGYISFDEPFRKLVNQGMIQGSSRFIYRVHGTNRFVSAGLKEGYQTDRIHVDVNLVDGLELDLEALVRWRPEYATAEFILEDGKYICGAETEKMSKRLFNTVNPDDLVARYGADTFRMYEMFLGPVEMSKPWDSKGIEGVHRFLKKFWRLFADEEKGLIVTNEAPTNAEWKVLHQCIRKIESDTERFSFNTAVSSFMIATNELTDLRCHKRAVLEPMLILLTPYAPHISQELWSLLGNSSTILDASFPVFMEKYVKETSKTYPVAINGKTRAELELSLEATQQEVEERLATDATVQKWLDGKKPRKVIYVKGKMINIVV